jgi:hypothetical protein
MLCAWKAVGFPTSIHWHADSLTNTTVLQAYVEASENFEIPAQNFADADKFCSACVQTAEEQRETETMLVHVIWRSALVQRNHIHRSVLRIS